MKPYDYIINGKGVTALFFPKIKKFIIVFEVNEFEEFLKDNKIKYYIEGRK